MRRVGREENEKAKYAMLFKRIGFILKIKMCTCNIVRYNSGKKENKTTRKLVNQETMLKFKMGEMRDIWNKLISEELIHDSLLVEFEENALDMASYIEILKVWLLYIKDDKDFMFRLTICLRHKYFTILLAISINAINVQQ